MERTLWRPADALSSRSRDPGQAARGCRLRLRTQNAQRPSRRPTYFMASPLTMLRGMTAYITPQQPSEAARSIVRRSRMSFTRLAIGYPNWLQIKTQLVGDYMLSAATERANIVLLVKRHLHLAAAVS